MQTCWINQKGAGTGKTWACVRLVCDLPQFKTYIYLSKMNTAKAVIKEEFESQYGILNARFIDDIAMIHPESLDGNKPQGEAKKVIVSTIDSMIYAFSNREIYKYTKGNYFSELVYSFDIERPKFKDDELVWNNVNFDESTLVIIDECQDLEDGYIDCFMSSLSTKGVSFYLMGDILQSIVEQNNIFSYIKDERYKAPGKFPKGMVFKRIDNSSEKIIRFHSKKFVDFANNIVEFEEFGANKIAKYCDNKNCKYKHENDPMFLVEESGSTKELFSLLKKVVVENNYEPEDILIITPIVDSQLVYRLEGEVNDFWTDFYNDKRSFHGKYSVLHTSKYGKIDVEISKYKTRILSVHAAKGMGGTFVILVNLTDRSLQSHQTKYGELKYESMVHVALTRQKENFLLYYNGADTYKDDLAKVILGTSCRVPMPPPQKRCIINANTLYEHIRKNIDLLNEFEDVNFIRKRMGALTTTEFIYKYLEPVDVKYNLMLNTMIKVLYRYRDDDTEYKYLKPSLKRLVDIENIEIVFKEKPEFFKKGDNVLELQDNPMKDSLLKLVESIREKIKSRGELCFLESYTLLYLLQKISPFTTIPVGDIYHRMARSINQGCRMEYHPAEMCTCLYHLDSFLNREVDYEDYCGDEEYCEYGFDEVILEETPMGDGETPMGVGESLLGVEETPLGVEESSPEETPSEESQLELLSLIPPEGDKPDGFGTAILSTFDDTMDYNPNFSINLGMSDFFIKGKEAIIVFTVPYVTYINFMEEITLPILLHSYLFFKANSKTRTAGYNIMLKQFFGMRKNVKEINSINFYINRLDNKKSHTITIYKNDIINKKINDVVAPIVKNEFKIFVKSWVNYYKEIKKNMDIYTEEEILSISDKKVSILEDIKNTPSEIVTKILNASGKSGFKKVMEKIINDVGDGFASDNFFSI